MGRVTEGVATTAARSVATSPSRSYNPLFFYGGVGMGKTHLMQAIAQATLDKYPGMRVVYTTGHWLDVDSVDDVLVASTF